MINVIKHLKDFERFKHVKKALQYLEKEALIDHVTGFYYMEDVFLREWIRVNLCSCAASLSVGVIGKNP